MIPRFSLFRMGNLGDDDRNQRDKERAAAKRRRFIRSANEPLIPFFCKVLFGCMIAAPILDLVTEFIRRAEGNFTSSAADFAVVVSWSVMMIWIFFAVFLLILSCVQLVRVNRFGYEEKKYYFEDEIPDGTMIDQYEKVFQPSEDENTDSDLILYAGEPGYDVRKKYLRYVITAAAGSIVLSLVYLICTRIAA